MTFNPTYNKDSFLVTRFYNHFLLGVKPQIEDHKKNIIEKIGDLGMWPAENLPGMLKRAATDPKVITVALTVFALTADSYLFYPGATIDTFKSLVEYIPIMAPETLKLTAYLGTVELISSLGTRAFGRFINEALMNKFYHINAHHHDD